MISVGKKNKQQFYVQTDFQNVMGLIKTRKPSLTCANVKNCYKGFNINRRLLLGETSWLRILCLHIHIITLG